MLSRIPLPLVLVISLLHAHTSAQWIQTNGTYGGPVECFAVSGTTIFAGTYGGGVFRSTNNGASWCAASSGLTNTQIAALTMKDSCLFAGTSNGVFRSRDNGSSWYAASSGLRQFPVHSFAVLGTDLFAGTAGVFRSTDNGDTWASANEGIPLIGHQGFFDPVGIWCFASIGSNLFAGTMGKGLIVTTNAGARWNTAHGWQTNNQIIALALVPGAIVSGATSLFAAVPYGGVYLSTDTSKSWSEVDSGLSIHTVLALAVSSHPGGGTGLFAGTNDGGVFLSTNNGTTWTSVNTGLVDSRIVSLAISGMGLFVGTQNGSVWRRPLSEMLPGSIPRLLAPPDLTVFYGGSFTFRWSSVQGALLYHLQSTGDSLFQTSLFVNDSMLVDTSRWSDPPDSTFGHPTRGVYYWRIRVKTASGWSAWSRPWRYVLSPCSVPESRNVPAEFYFGQNYPNPCNPSTTICYELPWRTHVALTVFNMLGQQIAQLVNGEVEAGYHQVRCDGRALASGVYMYRIEAGGCVLAKKFVIVK